MKILKIIGIIILLIIIVFIGLLIFIKMKTSNIEDKKDLTTSIDKLANNYVKKENAYALVVGVIKNGKVLLNYYGTTERGKSILPDSLTTFELASTSKLFTTSTLQILIDNNEVKLNENIQKILVPKVILPKIAENTTVQQLATHLSGFPSLPESFMNKMIDETNPYKILKMQDMYDYLKTCDEKKKEGEFEYSNFGMGLLGHVLELKTGIKYEKLVNKKLLNPIGMNNTFITVDKINKSNIIQGYDQDGNKAPIWTDNVLTGAGSFLSNGMDMMKFLKANLNSNATTISKSLIKTQDNKLNGIKGLGWMQPKSAEKLIGLENIVWHNGMAGGYSSFIAIDKTNNYGVFVLSNKAIDPTKLGINLALSLKTQSWKK